MSFGLYTNCDLQNGHAHLNALYLNLLSLKFN